MQKGILVAAVVVFAFGGVGWAMESDDIGVTVDATWVSKYIWRGFDLLDDKAAFQPSITLDLGSGFSVGVWASYAGSSGGGGFSTVNATEWDYFLTYNNSAFAGEAYQMDYAVTWLYYDLIDMPSKDADLQEINVAVAFPQICPGGIVPRYTAIYIWSAEGDGLANGATGWMHQFGIDYDIVLDEVIPNNPEQVITFSVDILYNDGAGAVATSNGPAKTDIDHDWSHVVWGLTTEVAAPFGGTFRPGIYYQTSMEKSVNPEDEFWTGLSYSLGF